MAHKDAVGLCLVCGELSFGKHYGCLSCLGCKTFFRRAVMHGQDTICKKPNICEQEVCARRLCRSCRFRRCLDMGMSREALQPRRDLIGRRKKRPTQIQFYQNNCVSTIPSTSGSEVTPSPTNHLLTPQTDILYSSISDGNNNLLDLISSLAATDKAIRARKFELIRARTEAKRLADVASKGSRVVQQHDTLMKIVLCSDLCNVTQIEMFSMLEWVQTIPAFSSLHLPDKMLLLKRFF
ncbi:unnamed protein product [Meloidogyne enterolobii]|uniref:Uncharacterized protein n=1 Tax=Meloidogyne enterolobii TaxID=390850 RepID=A0ACB1A1A4_MELEN